MSIRHNFATNRAFVIHSGPYGSLSTKNPVQRKTVINNFFCRRGHFCRFSLNRQNQGPEKTGHFRKFTGKGIFESARECLTIPLQPGRLLFGKKRKTRMKSKTPGALIYNVPGSRSGGIPLRAATDMVATPHCGARFLSVEKGFDEISRTAGHRILSPRPYRPRAQISAIDKQKSG